MSNHLTRYAVTVVTINKFNERHTNVMQTETLLGATRIIKNFTPKEGYEVLTVGIRDETILKAVSV